MARHSAARFETGQLFGALAISLLSATRKANPLEKLIRKELGDASGYISRGDVTELSRRHIFAHARVMRALAEQDKGKYSEALALFGDAMARYATGQAPDYIPALDSAREAVELAKQENR